MKRVKTIAQLLGSKWKAWLGFELVLQAIVLSLVGPALKLSLDAAMFLAGYACLTWENVGSFACTPACIAMVVVVVTLLAIVALFELAGLHYVFTCGEAAGRPRIRDAIRYAFRRSVRAVRPINFPVVPFLLVLFPIVGLGPTAGVVRSLSVPEFIMEYVEMNPLYLGAFLVVVFVLVVAAAFFVFSPIYFTADDISFPQAARKAREAGAHHVLGDAVFLIVASIIATIGVNAISSLVTAPVLAAGQGTSLWLGAIRAVSIVLSAIVSVPVLYAVCLALLEAHDAALPSAPALRASRVPAVTVPFIVGGVLVASLAGSAYFVVQNFIVPLQVIDKGGAQKIELTAHRGGTFDAPENTMAAFKQAARAGADVCELDVQQSKDGVVFVSHDSNFKRISGVDKGAWELTWDEICALDATGSPWLGEVETQRYPTLDEVIAWAKNNGMQLNIELKPTGHETAFEQGVVGIIRAHGFADRCVVTSQNYETVTRLKECASDLTCVYVSVLAYGDLGELTAADAFSLEETCVTPALTASLHAQGKQVYAWVLNSESTLRRAIGNGADNVITDDVSLAREVVDAANEQSPVGFLLYSIAAALS